jgi:hypothetical protein
MEHAEDIELLREARQNAVLKAETEIKSDDEHQSCPGVARDNLFSAVDSVWMVTQDSQPEDLLELLRRQWVR